MKTKTMTILLDRRGIDIMSATIQNWLEETGIGHKDILRIRLTMEELLIKVYEHSDDDIQAELRLRRGIGDWQLRVRYDGGRFDPTAPKESDIDEWTADLLARTGIMPAWRWRSGRNELLFRIPSKKRRPELITLGSVLAAIAIGLLGQFLPEAVKTGISDNLLIFLSSAFLHLLGTFIGLMIFLSIVTGICGIGSSSRLGRIGKVMISRFLISSFLTCGVLVFVVRFFYSAAAAGGGEGSQFHAILEMVFNIIPSNPVQPFLEGNTLQIVFLAAIVGIVLLITGSQTEGIRSLAFQAEELIRRCVTGVCILLPIYIFSSLVMLFWQSGAGLLLQFWKPLVIAACLCTTLLVGYFLVVCQKYKVRPSILIHKMSPSFLIALTTSSSAIALPTSMEINETKLGIEPSFSRTASPIATILFAGGFSLVYVLAGAFLAEYYGLAVDVSWWIILWFVSSLLALSTPPVAGGMISCLSILLLQMKIPQEGLVIGATLMMFLDYICTATRIPLVHCELILQADRLGLLDEEMLRR